MQTKSYDLEVVTPMFLSGADNKQAELRAASIKGQLRWWWRALNSNLSLVQLKKNEGDIFGSTDKKSSFSLFVTEQKVKIKNGNLPPGKKINYRSHGRAISIIDYLAFGIAVYDKASHGNKYQRPHIIPGSRFKLNFVFYDQNTINEVEKAFKYFVNFGGLGSKSRNGFGALQLLNGGVNNTIQNAGNRAKYTAFSSDSKLFIFNKHSSWVDALVEIGDIYRRARLSLEPSHVFERRPFVARPLIIKNEDVNIPDRQAKQFILHVSKIGAAYQGSILALPTEYKESGNQTDYDKVIQDMCSFLSKQGQKYLETENWS